MVVHFNVLVDIYEDGVTYIFADDLDLKSVHGFQSNQRVGGGKSHRFSGFPSASTKLLLLSARSRHLSSLMLLVPILSFRSPISLSRIHIALSCSILCQA